MRVGHLRLEGELPTVLQINYELGQIDAVTWARWVESTTLYAYALHMRMHRLQAVYVYYVYMYWVAVIG